MHKRITRAFGPGRILAMSMLVALLLAACDNGDGPPEATDAGRTGTFTSGVASGDVTDSSVVLWTRAEGADRPMLEVATDAAFTTDLRTERLSVSAERDWTLQHTLGGLQPATTYYYHFRAGDAVSPTGSILTAPATTDGRDVRFVFSGDSDGSRRPDGTPPYNEFEVLDAAAREDPAFFLYFGDTIYADRAPNATTLDGYRGKYRENRGYRALTDILAAAPIFTMWDDHEVVNDFAGTTADPAMVAAGRQAFREYMPIADTRDPTRLYRSFRYGRDIELIILDERSYRSASAADACAIDGRTDPLPASGRADAPDGVRAIRLLLGLPAISAGCEATLSDPARTLLGAEQKAWLRERLSQSDATWKVVLSSTPIQSLLALPYDRWEGYAAERTEVLRYIRDEAIGNVVFLATDFHANIFGPVRLDPFDAASSVAYEAVVGPIATATLRRDVVDVIGEPAAGVLDGFLTGVAGADCAMLDAYAYGLVETSDDGRTLTLTAKDEHGTVLCTKQLEAK